MHHCYTESELQGCRGSDTSCSDRQTAHHVGRHRHEAVGDRAVFVNHVCTAQTSTFTFTFRGACGPAMLMQQFCIAIAIGMAPAALTLVFVLHGALQRVCLLVEQVAPHHVGHEL